MKKMGLILGCLGVVGIFTTIMEWPCYSADSVIYACIKKDNGQVRIVSDPGNCRPSEVSVYWNQVGPQGQKGNKGDKGDPGPAGPVGVANGISRAVHGIVGWDGSIYGTGFSVEVVECFPNFCHTGIKFDQPFAVIPTCIAVGIQPPDYYDLVVFRIDGLSPTDFYVLYQEVTYSAASSGFTFICVE